MDAVDSERMSVLLSRYLDRYLGTREQVQVRRRGILARECIGNYGEHTVEFIGGSRADGFVFKGSDLDTMYIDKRVVVTYQEQPIPPDLAHKIVLYMRKADHCRPGFVTLQFGKQRQGCTRDLANALVQVGNAAYVSSEVYRELYVRRIAEAGFQCGSTGPSTTTRARTSSTDIVPAFGCISWPREANEWITRHRPYGWPSQTLIHTIVQGGCHLVPVGDKCSDDTRLQWRISLIKAERLLVHSFDHIQFKVYGLLKHLLKQLKSTLREIIGDDDILCSYYLKTVMFTAAENLHKNVWQEKNLFYCFWFCFNILIAWVKAGYCPNYFIPANNMFKRKVHGLNKQKLLHILLDIHEMKWRCLSIGTDVLPTIWESLCNTRTHSEWMNLNPVTVELNLDTSIAISMADCVRATGSNAGVHKALELLSKSQSDSDRDFIYRLVTTRLSSSAILYYPEHTVHTENKSRYRILRKCKRWLAPNASRSTDLLYLATFHFQTGNYRRTLEMCDYIMSSVWYYCEATNWSRQRNGRYMQVCCGRGYSLIHKMSKFAYDIAMAAHDLEFTPKQLHQEILASPMPVYIPPLPYAVFLSFLCCHELGDTRGRDKALLDLIAWMYDELQGGHMEWIVHTLLGICYETVGDNHRAIRSYRDSLQVETEFNPARERIAVLQRS